MRGAFWSKLNENKTWKLILSAAATVDHFLNRERERNQDPQDEITISLVILSVLRSPITLLYYFYLWLPLFWFTLFFKYLELIVRVSTRRSPRVKILMKHILAFHNSGLIILVAFSLLIRILSSVENLYHHIKKSHPIDIVNWLLQTCFEVMHTNHLLLLRS
jgi:hypothetical protein